jgi:hypothetical protein
MHATQLAKPFPFSVKCEGVLSMSAAPTPTANGTAVSGAKRARKPRSEESSARNTIILAIVVIVLAGYCVAFGLQTLVWLEANHWAKANPWIKDVPTPLVSSSVQKGGQKLTAFDYQFDVPFSGTWKTTEGPGTTEFHFDAGPVILFYDPQAQADMLNKLTSQNPLQYQQFSNAFVGQTFDTNYAIYEAVYGASPAGVSPFSSLTNAIRVNQLLLWKIAFGADAEPGLHSIQFGGNRGFQFGDPSSGRPVALRLFDGRDRQFRFVFLDAPGAATKFTQADIDSAAASLEPVPIVVK